MIPAAHKDTLAQAGRRIIEHYDAWGKPGEAAAWKARLGIPGLPADLFAPAPER